MNLVNLDYSQFLKKFDNAKDLERYAAERHLACSFSNKQCPYYYNIDCRDCVLDKKAMKRLKAIKNKIKGE